MDYTPATDYPFKIVPFHYDYAFKVTLARDCLFARRFIEITAELSAPIQHLEPARNEFEAMTLEAKSGIYDVVYRDEKLQVFIIEMQKDHFKVIKPRLMFYDFHYFNSQVAKGEKPFEKLSPVICICILHGRIYPGKADKNQYCWNFMFRDQPSGKVLSDKTQVRIIELGKFPILQKDWRKVKTDAEKLFYTMKYAHQFDPDNPAEVPDFYKEPWLAEPLKKLNLALMTPEERVMLDVSILTQKALKIQHEREVKKASKKAAKVAAKVAAKEATAKAEANVIQVIQLLRQGKSAQEIAASTGLSEEHVQHLIEQINPPAKPANGNGKSKD
ncbi:MAG: PD-(D/E)XK nuclease family transposase [Bacteroidota bacterium]